jgi:hypothetical protein
MSHLSLSNLRTENGRLPRGRAFGETKCPGGSHDGHHLGDFGTTDPDSVIKRCIVLGNQSRNTLLSRIPTKRYEDS